MKNNRFVISISLIALVISLIMIIGTKTNIFKTSYALEDSHTITIKKETDKNTDEEFEFRIKALKNNPGKYMYEVLYFEYSEYEIYGDWRGGGGLPFEMEGTGVILEYAVIGEYRTDLNAPHGENICIEVTENSYPFKLKNNSVYNSITDEYVNLIETGETYQASSVYEPLVVYKDSNSDYYFYSSPGSDVMYFGIKDYPYPITEHSQNDCINLPYYNICKTNEYMIYKNNRYQLYTDQYYTLYVLTDSDTFAGYEEYRPTILEEPSTSYLNLTDEKFTKISDGEYSFKLTNNEKVDISIPDGYTYEIKELTKDGWELVSINDDTSLTKAEGTVTDNMTYTFKNKSTTEEHEPVEPGNNEPQEPEEPASPNNNLEPKKEENKQNTTLSSKKITNDKTTPKTGVNTNISNIILIIGVSTLFFSILVLMNQVFRIKHSK